MKTTTLRWLTCILALVLLAGYAPATAQTCIDIVEDDWEEGFCDICGESPPAYECASFANWSNGEAFFNDPVPSGNIVTQIIATMTGVWGCSGPTANVTTQVEGETIATLTTPSGQCACGTCDAPFVTTSPVHPGGWPGYVYGGSNRFNAIINSGNICASSLALRICYEPESTCNLGPVLADIANLESKLDDDLRWVDEAELTTVQNTINANTNAAAATINTNIANAQTNIRNDVANVESKLDDDPRWVDEAELAVVRDNINLNVDAAETNIRNDVALVESKLDALDMGAVSNLESKLDDEARFSDDVELGLAVTSINNNVDAAETNIRNDVALVESKLDGLDVPTSGDIANLESKLDDDLRWVDEGELTTVQNTINANTNAAAATINTNIANAQTNIRNDVALVESKLDALDMGAVSNLESKLDDEARFTDDVELGLAVTSINNNVDAAETNIRTDVALVESKLDTLDVPTSGDVANLESKLDDDLRWVDEAELTTVQNTINANTDAAAATINTNIANAQTNIRNDVALVESKLDTLDVPTSGDVANLESKLDDDPRWVDEAELNVVRDNINLNVDAAETNIRNDVALVESKLDALDMGAVSNLESKLDDEARFTDDVELGLAVTNINANVDAAETSINLNVDAAEANIRNDVALVESKLDALDMGALVNLESKLDDEVRFTDDLEMLAVATSINGNIATAETSINANVDAAELSINTNVDAAETAIRNDIALVESKLDDIDMGALTALESKLDDEVRFTDDAELAVVEASINANVDAAETSINLNVDAAETSINANVDAAETSINANVDAAETAIRGDIALVESKLDDIDMNAIANLESKLDDEARFTDDAELAVVQADINTNVDAAETSINANVDAAETSINANVDAAETSINANVDAAETSINANVDAAETAIRDDIALVESKLDDLDMNAIANLESKLDDEARFTDDAELAVVQSDINANVDAAETSINANVDAAELSINTNVDAAELSINTNVDAAETAIRDDIALVESKLDDIDMNALANLESKLDDEARFTDDSELAIAQAAINANVDAAEASINANVDAAELSINTNVDAAETSINTNVDAAETSINANVDAAETNIRGDIALVESKLDDIATNDLANIESKLDDEARFTDDGELDAQTTTLTTELNENQAILEDAKSEIMLLESKLDALDIDVNDSLCEIIDLLLTKEQDRCSDTAGCGVGAWPTGLEMRPPAGACAASSAPVIGSPIAKSGGKAAQRVAAALASAPAPVDPAVAERIAALEANALEQRRSRRQEINMYVSAGLRQDVVDPVLVLPEELGGLFEQVAELTRGVVEAGRGSGAEPESMRSAELALVEAERLAAGGDRHSAYLQYRLAFRSLLLVKP